MWKFIKPVIKESPWGIGFASGAAVGWEPLTAKFWLVMIIAAVVSSLIEVCIVRPMHLAEKSQ
jgi:hypothetical protein